MFQIIIYHIVYTLDSNIYKTRSHTYAMCVLFKYI